MILWLARHGESLGNALQLIHGETDYLLTHKGRLQAEALRESVRRLPVERVVSSPLSRALETARIASALPVETDARLMEQSMGRWEAVSEVEARSIDAERYDAMLTDWTDERGTPPEGESFDDLLMRVGAAFHELSAANKNTLVVCHAGVMTAALVSLLGQSRKEALTARFEPGRIGVTVEI